MAAHLRRGVDGTSPLEDTRLREGDRARVLVSAMAPRDTAGVPPSAAAQPPEWAAVERIARDTFGVTSFRPGQRALIEAVLAGRDALGILPTGGGKSLCFQLPSLLVPGLVLVVSPLIALMADQTARLDERNVPAEKLDSTLSAADEAEAEDAIRTRHAEIVYTTPERLERPEVVEMFRRRGVSLLVIDEAHCVSQWGHDFRPAFLGIRDARAALGNPPVLALTATATREIAADILAQLGVPNAQVVRAALARTNIELEVRRTPSEDAKERMLRRLVVDEPTRELPAIVYATTIKIVEATHELLRGWGVRVARYHGRLGKHDRAGEQTRFMEGEADVMVATSAFGMGIDKADVRLVVHLNFPDSLETYYQEAGRAGRDGQPARAVLLYRLEDRRVQAYFLGGKYPKPADFQAVWNVLAASTSAVAVRAMAKTSGLPERVVKVVVAQLQAMGLVERGGRGVRRLRDFRDAEELAAFVTSYETRFATDREKLEHMMEYAQSTGCRTARVLTYFGETAAERCEHCDNCRDGPLVLPPEPVVAQIGGTSGGEAATFRRGELVRHRRFGVGVVEDVEDARVTVEFERVGVKTVRGEYLAASAPAAERA